MSKFQRKVWGVPGKMNVYYSPGKFQAEKRIVPLNSNPLEPWDATKSRYKRVDLVPKEVQQMDGINESSAQSVAPVVSPTPSVTASQTPSPTPSFTPTMTQTQTPSLTPSSTPYPLPINPSLWWDATDSSTFTLISSGGTNYVSRWNSKGTSTWSLSGSNTDQMPTLSASTLMPGNPNIVRFVPNATTTLRDALSTFGNTSITHTGGTWFYVWAKPSGSTYATSLYTSSVYSGFTNGGTVPNSAGGFIDRQFFNLTNVAGMSNNYSIGNNQIIALSTPVYSATGLNDKFMVSCNFQDTTGEFNYLEINQSAQTNTTSFTGSSAVGTVNSFIMGMTITVSAGTPTYNNSNVELAEVMWFNVDLTPAQREQVELYLKDKWRYDEWASPVPTATPTASPTNTPTTSVTPTLTTTPTPSSTPPPFSPSSLSPNIWVDFSDATTITTRTSGSQSFITRITNKGTDASLTAFTQSTAANQPEIKLSTVFTGTSISAVTCSNDFLTGIANTPNSNSWTVAVVVGRTDSNDTATSLYGMAGSGLQKNTYWDRTSTSSRIGYFNNGASTFYRVDVTNPVTSTWSGQSYIEFVSTTGASQLDYYFTNTSAMTESVVAGSNYTQNTPGASALTLFNSDGTTANIQVGEMLFLTRELTSTERTNLLNYFRTKWGLTY